MLYLALAVGAALLLLYGGMKIEHSGKVAAQAQAKAATDANKSLAADCKTKIDTLTSAAQARATADAKRSADAAAARKRAAEKAKADAGKLTSLQAIADNPQKLTPDAECAAMRVIVRDAAK